MIFIYKELIKNNISKLKINHLEDFAKKNNLVYSNDELVIVYNFIMYNYNALLDENIKIFEELKEKINSKLYKDLLNLYIEYKQKYL